MRIAIVQGTRPEIIKNYSLVKALEAAKLPYQVLHTGQHSCRRMSADIYSQMGYAPSRRFLGTYRLGSVINWLQSTYAQDRISCVVVNGDTAAAMAGALSALYLDIPIVHIEAGLRAGDAFMIEERNRIAVDAFSSMLFAYTEHERATLEMSPDIRGAIFVEGNTTVDVFHDFADAISRAESMSGRYLLATMHRKEFTDSAHRMRAVFGELASLAAHVCPVVFPMHPRTRDAMTQHDIPVSLLGQVQVIEPVPALESFALLKGAAALLTDSGCMQEEAYMMQVPCITIRDNTERHLTIQHGANVLVGFDAQRLRAAVVRVLNGFECQWPSIYGAPGAGARILERLVNGLVGAASPTRQRVPRTQVGTDDVALLSGGLV